MRANIKGWINNSKNKEYKIIVLNNSLIFASKWGYDLREREREREREHKRRERDEQGGMNASIKGGCGIKYEESGAHMLLKKLKQSTESTIMCKGIFVTNFGHVNFPSKIQLLWPDLIRKTITQT